MGLEILIGRNLNAATNVIVNFDLIKDLIVFQDFLDIRMPLVNVDDNFFSSEQSVGFNPFNHPV